LSITSPPSFSEHKTLRAIQPEDIDQGALSVATENYCTARSKCTPGWRSARDALPGSGLGLGRCFET
ncbi:MAG TPA: hypothetical protein PKC22_12520, partial [Rhodocyclaceae bacterium]|nr:hypothetical protein [Rhodocyclaceae bacterium]